MSQSFQFENGVLQGCESVLLQADGSFLFEEMAVITESGSWTAPAGVSQLRVIIGQGGQGSSPGEDGYVGGSGILPGSGVAAGEGQPGVAGQGGKIWYATIDINPQQVFEVTIGQGGAPSTTYGTPGSMGGETTFGPYSSANGQVYPLGFTDVASGNSYARTGVQAPVSGTGDGAAGGAGGSAGAGYWKTLYWTPNIPGYSESNAGKTRGWDFIVTVEPGPGAPGKAGASGFVAIYWDKPDS